MKIIARLNLAVLSLSVTCAVHAATPGAYVGAGLGTSKIETSDQNLFNIGNSPNGSNSVKRGGLGGRAYAGFNFNEYLGIEAGIARYAKSRYSSSLNNLHSSLEYSLNAFDLVAKTYLPFGERRFNLYALGGVAAVGNTTQFSDGGIPFINDFFPPSGSGTRTKYKIRPIYGIGVGYDIPKSHFTTGVEFTRIQGAGNVNTSINAMPPAQMVSFSLTYNFN